MCPSRSITQKPHCANLHAKLLNPADYRLPVTGHTSAAAGTVWRGAGSAGSRKPGASAAFEVRAVLPARVRGHGLGPTTSGQSGLDDSKSFVRHSSNF